ncbi:MAG: hypothetical protein AB1634_04595 [Thermodesulfobacteriota bacterium]
MLPLLRRPHGVVRIAQGGVDVGVTIHVPQQGKDLGLARDACPDDLEEIGMAGQRILAGNRSPATLVNGYVKFVTAISASACIDQTPGTT